MSNNLVFLLDNIFNGDGTASAKFSRLGSMANADSILDFLKQTIINTEKTEQGQPEGVIGNVDTKTDDAVISTKEGEVEDDVTAEITEGMKTVTITEEPKKEDEENLLKLSFLQENIINGKGTPTEKLETFRSLKCKNFVSFPDLKNLQKDGKNVLVVNVKDVANEKNCNFLNELKNDDLFKGIVGDMNKFTASNGTPCGKKSSLRLLYCSLTKLKDYIHHYIGMSDWDEGRRWLKKGNYFNHGEAFELMDLYKRKAQIPLSVKYTGKCFPDSVTYCQIVRSTSPKPYEDTFVIYTYVDNDQIREKLLTIAPNEEIKEMIRSHKEPIEILETIFIRKYKEAGNMEALVISKKNSCNVEDRLDKDIDKTTKFFKDITPTGWMSSL